jgi:hypothetical protein
VTILAVNPSGAEMEKLLGVAPKEEPVYTGTDEKLKVPNCRVTFIVQPIGCEEVSPQTITFFLTKAPMISQSGKCKVIDKYGRTCWVTKEEFKAKAIPMYANGPANVDKNYKPCIVGQEELTNFIKNFLGINNPMRYDKTTNTWYMGPNPQDCECSLDNIDSYFTGDISEIKKAIAMQPENSVTVMFGIRTTQEGKQYQAFYKDLFLRGDAGFNLNDASYAVKAFTKSLTAAKERGAFPTTEFLPKAFQEYEVTATNFKEQSADETVMELPDFDTPTVSDGGSFDEPATPMPSTANNVGSEDDLPW